MSVNSRSGAHASPALKSALVLVQTFLVPLLNNECKIVLKMAKRLGLVAHTSQHLGGRAVGLLSSRLARLCSETDRNKNSWWMLTKILFVKLLIPELLQSQPLFVHPFTQVV